ncbi:MAG TPA: nitrite/sulfite reductase, partial [Roseiflexaceae bacterium]|nr:nitrite/sulfite reductase [Roseiflexaceae bacterium]
YNLQGRRDNLYKSRIKILVHDIGAAKFAELVEAEWRTLKDSALRLPDATIAEIAAHFAPPSYETLEPVAGELAAARLEHRDFNMWVRSNVAAHKAPGYAIVNLSLKKEGAIPGDASANQMEALADLAERYSLGEIRVAHEQNLVLPHVRQKDLFALWQALQPLGLASANIGLISDIIACPGLDYCSLANARSIPVAQRIALRFADLKQQHEIGELKINISGCINACGHHHVGHIGLLGVDKNGEEFYQITLGGSGDEKAAIGSIIGPAVASDQVVEAMERLVETYLSVRGDGERFIDTYRRVGPKPFKERLYAAH